MKIRKDGRASYLAVGGITLTVLNVETVRLSLDPSFRFLHQGGGNWTRTFPSTTLTTSLKIIQLVLFPASILFIAAFFTNISFSRRGLFAMNRMPLFSQKPGCFMFLKCECSRETQSEAPVINHFEIHHKVSEQPCLFSQLVTENSVLPSVCVTVIL